MSTENKATRAKREAREAKNFAVTAGILAKAGLKPLAPSTVQKQYTQLLKTLNEDDRATLERARSLGYTKADVVNIQRIAEAQTKTRLQIEDAILQGRNKNANANEVAEIRRRRTISTNKTPREATITNGIYVVPDVRTVGTLLRRGTNITKGKSPASQVYAEPKIQIEALRKELKRTIKGEMNAEAWEEKIYRKSREEFFAIFRDKWLIGDKEKDSPYLKVMNKIRRFDREKFTRFLNENGGWNVQLNIKQFVYDIGDYMDEGEQWDELLETLNKY